MIRTNADGLMSQFGYRLSGSVFDWHNALRRLSELGLHMGSTKTVAIISPSRLGNAFMVLLHSAPAIRPLTSATDVDTVLLALADEVPDVILLYVDEDSAGRIKGQVTREQVRRSKAAWPNALCVVVVKDYRLRDEVKSMGADVVFNAAVDPAILLETVDTDLPDETESTLPGPAAAAPVDEVATPEDDLN